LQARFVGIILGRLGRALWRWIMRLRRRLPHSGGWPREIDTGVAYPPPLWTMRRGEVGACKFVAPTPASTRAPRAAAAATAAEAPGPAS